MVDCEEVMEKELVYGGAIFLGFAFYWSCFFYV